MWRISGGPKRNLSRPLAGGREGWNREGIAPSLAAALAQLKMQPWEGREGQPSQVGCLLRM